MSVYCFSQEQHVQHSEETVDSAEIDNMNLTVGGNAELWTK